MSTTSRIDASRSSVRGQFVDQLVLAHTGSLEHRVNCLTKAPERLATGAAVVSLDGDEEPNGLAVALDDECLASAQHRRGLVPELPDADASHAYLPDVTTSVATITAPGAPLVRLVPTG